jgi:hypothetical protein
VRIFLDGCSFYAVSPHFHAISAVVSAAAVYCLSRAGPRAASRGFILLRIVQLLVGLALCRDAAGKAAKVRARFGIR